MWRGLSTVLCLRNSTKTEQAVSARLFFFIHIGVNPKKKKRKLADDTNSWVKIKKRRRKLRLTGFHIRIPQRAHLITQVPMGTQYISVESWFISVFLEPKEIMAELKEYLARYGRKKGCASLLQIQRSWTDGFGEANECLAKGHSVFQINGIWYQNKG